VNRLPVLALGAFVLGVALMVPFEATITLILGLALLFTSIVAGVFAIATPELLSDDEVEEE
jgi:uncharacterized protein (DUF58 family)